MAENVSITAGSGTVIATDDCTVNAVAVQVQRIKAGWGVDSSYNDPAIATPLPAQVTAEVSQMSSLGTIVTPQFATINTSSSGNNSIVALVAGKSIRVLSYVLVADAANAVKWQSDTVSPVDLTGAMSLAANGGIAAPYCPVGHLQSASGKALCLNLASALGVRGHLTYIAV